MQATLRGVVGVLVFCIGSLSAAQSQEQKSSDFQSALPEKVAKLTAWPAAEQIAEKRVLPETLPEAKRAMRASVGWIQAILEPKWLPDDLPESLETNMVLYRDACEGLDTSHVEWEKSGYRFRASQTCTVFHLEVIPTQGKLGDGEVPALRQAARELTDKLIREASASIDEIFRPEEIAADGTKAVLLSNSFDRARVEEFANGVAALPPNRGGENRLDGARWFFWWRRLGWWTNGETLGLFAPKGDGGPWVPGYNASWDKNWFDPPESR